MSNAKLTYVPESRSISSDEKINILIVEDDLNFRDNISRHFQKDYFVDSVSTPEEASNLLKDRKYDLLLTDIRFDSTSLSGDEFVMRNSHLFDQAKIVAYTGFQSGIRPEARSFFDKIINKGDLKGFDYIEQAIESIRQNKFSNSKPSIEQESLALTLFEEELKLAYLVKDEKYKISDENKELHNIVYTLPSETHGLRTSIEELESLVNDRKSKEADFQDFFKRNKDFVLNEDYREAYPHIYLEKNDGRILIPDFVLEPVNQAKLCDLLELKLPHSPLYVLKENRERFSSAVMEACAQLREYSAYFDQQKYREKIYQKYGLSAFKPKMFVIIGRTATINPMIRKRIESDVPGINVKSYDEIIEQKKFKLKSWITGRRT